MSETVIQHTEGDSGGGFVASAPARSAVIRLHRVMNELIVMA
jgi:hypothetical protein